MGRLRRIEDLGTLESRIVLVRVDYNVPMDDTGRVSDDTRIRASLATIDDLRRADARVVLMSHFGRPKGARRPEMSLRPVVGALESLVGERVVFAEDCIGEPAAAAIAEGAGITLLENLRFHPGEEADDPDFAAALAANGDFYVDDAFSVAHRAHASVHAIAHLLPSAAGRAFAAEIDALERVLSNPERPLAAIIGGAKISTKIEVLEALLEKVDHLMIGGAMANTFLKAKGLEVGRSLIEEDRVETARRILANAAERHVALHLPRDLVVAREFREDAPTRVCAPDEVADDEMILDFGPATVRSFIEVLSTCRSLIWNGPLGAFETHPFERATVALAEAVAEMAGNGELVAVAGGGDTVAALHLAGVADRLTHVSTAGGAFLEWMEGRTLPGVAVLTENDEG
ncbi:MAG: phosphoglycerate kinase [Alphaproteobacteria bacterium]|nr:MAG: phosphoglycerate kinase [Alphaproteobacteria bacterium]